MVRRLTSSLGSDRHLAEHLRMLEDGRGENECVWQSHVSDCFAALDVRSLFVLETKDDPYSMTSDF